MPTTARPRSKYGECNDTTRKNRSGRMGAHGSTEEQSRESCNPCDVLRIAILWSVGTDVMTRPDIRPDARPALFRSLLFLRLLRIGRWHRRRNPCGQLLSRPRTLPARVPQIRIQRVIADSEHAARTSLVTSAAFEHQVRVAAAPHTHRFRSRDGGLDDLRVIAAHLRREVVELDARGLRQRNRPFD